eukprot:CAMPEP_0173356556 /NCGR_PEP_ID=MMETSP1144-20121109/18382_1 /TAXON_ID=483371 /ORGANISM="non described non described, Strain CCMP2298" /LENGTH=170 /DNA_ID=CAMNT_0014305381 /DNA_START=388 /DNA_END=901 /DNA_ORIENTATION=+
MVRGTPLKISSRRHLALEKRDTWGISALDMIVITRWRDKLVETAGVWKSLRLALFSAQTRTEKDIFCDGSFSVSGTCVRAWRASALIEGQMVLVRGLNPHHAPRWQGSQGGVARRRRKCALLLHAGALVPEKALAHLSLLQCLSHSQILGGGQLLRHVQHDLVVLGRLLI